MSISISDIASPCPTEQSYKGKSYGDMIGKDAKILEGGVVVGTVKHVTGYTEAFEGKEADGFFFPVHLADAYKQKAIRVQRVSGKGGKEKQTEDTDWVLRLTDGQETVYTFKLEGEDEPFLTLSFRMASFEQEPGYLAEVERASHSVKNYVANCGDEWVIGGKLTILPDAVVEGLEAASRIAYPMAALQQAKLPYIADSEATTVAALKESFNGLLAALRDSGLMEASAPD